jgi:hypothetical protein
LPIPMFAQNVIRSGPARCAGTGTLSRPDRSWNARLLSGPWGRSDMRQFFENIYHKFDICNNFFESLLSWILLLILIPVWIASLAIDAILSAKSCNLPDDELVFESESSMKRALRRQMEIGGKKE